MAWAADPDGASILSATGVQAGLAVHLGTTDGALEMALTHGGTILVHGLALTDAARENARAAIFDAGLYPLASVERAKDLSRLPYSANQVNLLVADLDALSANGLKADEVQRVLVPGGAAYLKQGGNWQKTVKPQPSNTDDWSHWNHGPDGNPRSADQLMKPPTGIKWAAQSWKWSNPEHPARYPAPANTGYRIAGGRAFYDYPRPPEPWPNQAGLVGRDAYNGLLLWRRDGWKNWDNGWDHGNVVATADRLITFGGDKDVGFPLALDAATGAVLKTYDQGIKASGSAVPFLLVSGNTLIEAAGTSMVALDLSSGAKLWGITSPDGGAFASPIAVAKEGKVYAATISADITKDAFQRWGHASSVKSLYAFDLAGGAQKWKSDAPGGKILSHLLYDNGVVAVCGSQAISGGGDGAGHVEALDAASGATLWTKGSADLKVDYLYNPVFWNGMLVLGCGWSQIGLDEKTGKQLRGWTISYNERCARHTATDNYFSSGIVHYTDKNGKWLYETVARSYCSTGQHFAYGMTYFTSNACGCLPSQVPNWDFQRYGAYQALVAEALPPAVPDAQRLETPAAASGALLPSAKQRAAGPRPVPAGPIPADWGYSNIYAPTAPVAAGDKSLVAYPNEHRIEATSGGNVAWNFIAGGRIAHAPTVIGDKCYFGANDGWVYCLKVADGSLVWRYMAAPAEKKITVYGELESAWPVFGVVQHGGNICFSAGHHPETDGGIFIYGVNPATGALSWKTRLSTQLQFLDSADRAGNNTFDINAYECANQVMRDSANLLWIGKISIDPSNPKAISMMNIKPSAKHGSWVIKTPPVPYGPDSAYVTVGVRTPQARALPAAAEGLSLADLGARDGMRRLAVEAPGAYRLSIRGLSGREVFARSGGGAGEVEVPVKLLRPGAYAARLEAGGGVRELGWVQAP